MFGWLYKCGCGRLYLRISLGLHNFLWGVTRLCLLRDFTQVLIENNKSKDTKIEEKLLSYERSKESKKMAATV